MLANPQSRGKVKELAGSLKAANSVKYYAELFAELVILRIFSQLLKKLAWYPPYRRPSKSAFFKVERIQLHTANRVCL